MRLLFCMLPLLVSAHDNKSHYEEAKVSQEDQNDRDGERPDEGCCRIQITAVREL